MSRTTILAFCLAVSLSAAAGFAGARAMSAAEKKTNVDADTIELDRTAKFLEGHLMGAVSTMKQIARDTTAENIESEKAQREKAINDSLKPLQEDTFVLLFQGHFLNLDSVVDKTGAPAEQFIQQGIYDKLKVDAAEVAKRREATGMGHGSLILGYVIAKIANKPADEIFAAKKDRSWAEVMRIRGISPAQVTTALEAKQ
jgi:hypothetical protein